MTYPSNWFDDGAITRKMSKDEEHLSVQLYESLNALTPFERFQWLHNLLKQPDTQIPYYIKGIAFVIHKELKQEFPSLS